MGLATFLMVRAVEVGIVILLIVFMPSIPPNVNFTEYKVAPPLPLEGKLAINERLNGVEHLFENELKGPEAFADFNGELYSTLHGGDVVKLVGDHVVPIVKFGKPCKGFHEESICGRPLGLNFDKDGKLFVADAYMGIWQVDVKTGKKIQLVSMDKEIEGKKPLLPNSLAISKTGDIYWTDSSTDFRLEDGVFSLLGDGSGRLIHYNPTTKINTVLISGLQFANGVVLSADEDFVIISETGKSRILRYYLKGPKKGTHDIFIDGLPGLPDNLKNDGKDGFLVPLVFARDADHPAVFQVVGPFPLVRKFAARLLGLAELGFRTVERIYPNFYTQKALHWVGHFESITLLIPHRATILHLSKDGEILDCLHSMDNSVASVSDVHVFKDSLYFGSPYNTYVGKLPLSNAGVEHLGRYKSEAIKKTAQQPKEAAPKPTAAPAKQSPPPTAAPVKQAPAAAQVPVKKTAPPTAAPAKQAPSPVAAKQVPPSPVKPAPKVEPVKQAPKVEAVKQAPKVEAVKQAPKVEAVKPAPKVEAVKPAPKEAVKPAPKVEAVKQAPKVEAVKPAPKVEAVKQAPKVEAVKQAPKVSPTAAPAKQAAPAPSKQQPAAANEPPVVPVKEKVMPKSESIPPRK